MGGCRCVYRSCQNSTTVTPGLHYFHFPVRDPPRCELWIQNAQKPAFRDLEKDRLRNKVICSIHFENKCFTNEKHDRLIHSAVPTLGFEDDVEQPIQPDPILGSNFQMGMGDDNIMLIPIDEDNTKFALPNVEFAGMSYTIFDDAVIPTSKIEEVIINELKNNPTCKPKEQQLKSVVKQIKTNLPSLKRAHSTKNTNKHRDISQFTVFNNENDQQIRPEVKIVNTTAERSNNNIPSYSVSTLNGDVSVEPSIATHILPDIITDNEQQMPNFPTDPTVQSNLNSNLPSMDNFSIDLKSDNENEFTMSVTPVGLIKNFCNNENSQEAKHFIEQPIVQPTIQTIEHNENNQQLETNDVRPAENINNTEYVEQIKTNTKQIKQLKNLVKKQSRFNRMLWQKKKMPHFKKKINRTGIINMLKNYIKPSLLAMLKLELLPVEEVVLNDQEEKFITDLYTEYPECYDLLRTKFNWNLPFPDNIDEPENNEELGNMQCE